MVLSLLFAPSGFIHLERNVIPHLHGYWSSFVSKVDCFSLYLVSLQICRFVFWLVYFLTWLWESSKHSLLLSSWCHDKLNIYFGTSTRPARDQFALTSCGWGLTVLSYLSWILVCLYSFALYLFSRPMTLKEYLTLFNLRNGLLVAYFLRDWLNISVFLVHHTFLLLPKFILICLWDGELILEFIFYCRKFNNFSNYLPLNISDRYEVP